jgi:hypothetical protein
VRWDVVRQDQDRRLAGAHEVARHGVDEVGALGVHVGEKVVHHLHRDVRPARAERWTPALHVILVGEIGQLRTEPAGLRQYGRDDALGRPLQQVPDEGAADAEAQHHAFPDT